MGFVAITDCQLALTSTRVLQCIILNTTACMGVASNACISLYSCQTVWYEMCAFLWWEGIRALYHSPRIPLVYSNQLYLVIEHEAAEILLVNISSDAGSTRQFRQRRFTKFGKKCRVQWIRVCSPGLLPADNSYAQCNVFACGGSPLSFWKVRKESNIYACKMHSLACCLLGNSVD